MDARHQKLDPLEVYTDISIEGDSAQKELFAAWALFISIMLLIVAFFTSYLLQQKKVTAVHETVISIFAGSYLLPQFRLHPLSSLIAGSRNDGRPHPRHHPG